MSSRAETLPSDRSTIREPLPGSRKVYVSGPHGMRVPFREVALSPTRGVAGEVAVNPPLRLYDTSGPYTDPDTEIDVTKGLAEIRKDWILARGPYDASEPVRANAPSLALSRPRKALRGRGAVTQMHYARKGIVTPE